MKRRAYNNDYTNMEKLIRPYVYKKEYDKVIQIAKQNYLRTGQHHSFAMALRYLIDGND